MWTTRVIPGRVKPRELRACNFGCLPVLAKTKTPACVRSAQYSREWVVRGKSRRPSEIKKIRVAGDHQAAVCQLFRRHVNVYDCFPFDFHLDFLDSRLFM